MKNMLIEVLICLVLILTELIIVVTDYYIRKRSIDKKIKNVELTEELSNIVLEYYDYFSKKELKGIPYIRAYILQAQEIIIKYPYNLFNLEVTTMNEVDKRDKKLGNPVRFEKVFEELINSPEYVQKLFFRMNKVLENIYKVQHPVKYMQIQIKKNIKMQIIKVFLKICKYRTNKVEKQNIKELPVKTTKISYNKKYDSKLILNVA